MYNGFYLELYGSSPLSVPRSVNVLTLPFFKKI